MIRETESIQGDNLEESDQAQLHSIHLNMNALAEHRRRLAKQAELPSAELCEDCGESIPEQRRVMIPGCQCCVSCQSIRERTAALHGR